MGLTFDNALLSVGFKDKQRVSPQSWLQPGRHSRSRMRPRWVTAVLVIAACYLDSGASQELPLWGYGLRYKYGIFQQLISPEGDQLEAPDPWLDNQNPWEVGVFSIIFFPVGNKLCTKLPRLDVEYEVRFFDNAESG